MPRVPPEALLKSPVTLEDRADVIAANLLCYSPSSTYSKLRQAIADMLREAVDHELAGRCSTCAALRPAAQADTPSDQQPRPDAVPD